MSGGGMFSKLFGGKKKQGTTVTPDEGIQRLRGVEEILQKKSDYLEDKVKKELAVAKENGTRNKRVAIAALKRKKRYEKQLMQIDGTLSTIEFQIEALENASTNTEVLTVMKTASEALKGAHKNMDVDQVQDIMDDVAEQHEIANEIAEAISNPVGFGQDFDEDELENELEELEQEELDRKMTSIGAPGADLSLPSVPSASLPAQPQPSRAAAQEDDDLAELNAWAAAS